MEGERIALTFGDAGENHVGMEMVGKLGKTGSGFTPKELKKLQKYFKESGYETEYLNLDYDEENKAGVLIVRDYETSDDEIFKEMHTFEWDTKYYDIRRKRVLNKLARSNVCILDGIEQKPDYENKKGTIIDGDKLPRFKEFKEKLLFDIKSGVGKELELICEGNRYTDMKKHGIGYHGDKERRIVICLSIGCDDYPIQWVWFEKFLPIKKPVMTTVNSGDIYIMSEKAVGWDWKKSSIKTMRHAAGAEKYRSLKKYEDLKTYFTK